MIVLQPERNIADIIQDYDVYNELIWELKENDSWKIVARQFGIFSTSDIRRFERDSSPPDVLLEEIGMRNCTVGVFCEILELCQLFGALSILAEPEPLVIVQQPSGQEFVVIGGELQLEIVATGLPPPKYLWYYGNEELPDQTSNVLRIDDFGPQHEGDYYCIVSQEVSETTIHSNEISVEIMPEKPVIEEQPSEVVCQIGEDVTLSCVCEGYPPPNFQWIFGNTILEGEGSNTLTIPCAQLADSGIYKVYVSNKAGEVYSDPVQVSVYEYEDSEGLEDEFRVKKPRLKVQEKLALLIANDKYSNLKCLKTPTNDVATLSEILSHLGFKVLALQNLTLVQMRSAVREFCKMIPEGAYVIFYFVGHGFDMNGKYMIPVDAPEPDSYRRSDCLCEEEVVRDVLEMHPKLFIILLDMCLKAATKKENPGLYEEKMNTFRYKPARNLIQGYATTTGLGAYERINEKNGIYMKHLAKFLAKDWPIVKILAKVNESISNESEAVAELQMPSYTNNVVVDLHYLTSLAEENVRTKTLYEKYTTVMHPKTIVFKQVNTHAPVSFFLHKNCFHNVMEILIKNLENWFVAVDTECMGLKLEVQRQNKDLLITVHNLQDVKIPMISFNIKLIDRTTINWRDTTILELEENPLIASARLWYNPHLMEGTEYM